VSTETPNEPEAQDRGARRTREGIVIKDKMNKTIIVEVTRMLQHPEFDKVVRRRIKYATHDEKNEAKVGNKVRILQTRPLSKTKRWTLLRVLEQ